MTRRAAALVALCLAASGCMKLVAFDPTSAAARADRCDPEHFALRNYQEQERIVKAYNADPRREEMVVYTAMPADRARSRVMELMLACKMPVSGSSEGVLTADYGAQIGMLGTYTLTANAYIVAVDDTTTLIRFAGREQSRSSSGTSTGTISSRNQGRSLGAWNAMRAIAKQLHLDPAAKVDVARSTPMVWVFAGSAPTMAANP